MSSQIDLFNKQIMFEIGYHHHTRQDPLNLIYWLQSARPLKPLEGVSSPNLTQTGLDVNSLAPSYWIFGSLHGFSSTLAQAPLSSWWGGIALLDLVLLSLEWVGL